TEARGTQVPWTPVVDDGPVDVRLGHQLPDAGRACGGRAEAARRPGHHDAAVLVDSERFSDRDHAAADLRIRDGHHRPEGRLRDVRHGLVIHLYGPRVRGHLAD